MRTHAARKIKLPLVPWTYHHTLANFAAGEIPTGVRTGVIDHDDLRRIEVEENGQFTTPLFNKGTLPRTTT